MQRPSVIADIQANVAEHGITLGDGADVEYGRALVLENDQLIEGYRTSDG